MYIYFIKRGGNLKIPLSKNMMEVELKEKKDNIWSALKDIFGIGENKNVQEDDIQEKMWKESNKDILSESKHSIYNLEKMFETPNIKKSSRRSSKKTTLKDDTQKIMSEPLKTKQISKTEKDHEIGD